MIARWTIEPLILSLHNNNTISTIDFLWFLSFNTKHNLDIVKKYYQIYIEKPFVCYSHLNNKFNST